MFLKLLLITQMICRMPIKILMSTIQERKVLILLDDMIAGIISNERLNPTVTEL